MHGDTLYYVYDKYVRAYDINTGSSIGLFSVRKFGSPYIPPRTLSSNPAEHAVGLTISSDNSLYELTSLPKDTSRILRALRSVEVVRPRYLLRGTDSLY